MSKPYLSHLKSAAGLQTTYEAVRAGFVALALEKNRRATPYVAQARALQESASHAKRPKNLLSIAEIQPALVTAAGVSDKAADHLQSDDKHTAVLGLIENFLEPAGEKFVEELVFRFLLTRGDTTPADLGKPTFNNPAAYIALGELKGGIDPAGADEHWKTARTALNRIQTAFSKHKLKPHMFFIGAAIESKMSQEIWSLLKKGVIENAANLTDERQIASITRWLCSL
ncbi:MAG: hypothetical protein NTY65_17745 [Planctomycetota bacterium]|nr:hypothetical protein [Planctomycetota bacterium]